MKIRWISGVAALAFCGQAALAQEFPVYESTGTINLAIDGKPATYHTTSNTIPHQPDKLVHTANWRSFAPMMLAGVNMAPPGLLVSLLSRQTIEPDSASPQLKLTFSLHDTDHVLLDSPPPEVIYIVKEGPLAGEYRRASGTLDIVSVTPEAGDILAIRGRASGTLAGVNDKKGAGPLLGYEADFNVQARRH